MNGLIRKASPSVGLSAALLVALLGVACAPAAPVPAATSTPPAPTATPVPSPSPTPPFANLGKEFTLSVGQMTGVQGLGPVVFVGVKEDSRCPSDVTCIQAGRAVVVLRVGTVGNEVTLISGPASAGEATATVDGYEIRLISVNPYPKSTTPIKPNEYRATLVVTQAGVSQPSGRAPGSTPEPGSIPTPGPTPDTYTDGFILREVPITAVEVLILESFPVQVRARVTGYFSDGCTTLHSVRQSRTGNDVTVTISSKRPKDAFCTQAIVPYESTISLGGQFPPGSYSVAVNGVRRDFQVS